MLDSFKQRMLAAVDRAMLYCLKVHKGEHCVTYLGKDKIVPVDELYNTIVHLRGLIPNKDQARFMHGLVNSTMSDIKDEKQRSALQPILEILEVLSGQS